MTKSETREMNYVQASILVGRLDMAARALATLYRAASARSQREIAALAAHHGLTNRPEYII